MAKMPGTRWLGEHGSSLMTRYDIVCIHTIVGFAPAHAAHFSVHSDGTIDQSRDTRYKSAANLDGNPRIIAIENEDHGSPFPPWSGSDVPALTLAQVQANAAILRWAHETHGVPLQLCPDSRPTSRGLAYHRQGIDGNFTTYPGRVAGGEVWSSSRGKVCPGDRRISQRGEILRLAIAMGDEDMPTPAEFAEAVMGHVFPNGQPFWRWLETQFNELPEEVQTAVWARLLPNVGSNPPTDGPAGSHLRWGNANAANAYDYAKSADAKADQALTELAVIRSLLEDLAGGS